MAFVKSKVMTVGESVSADVVGYRVRYTANSAGAPSYSDPYFESASNVIDLADVPALAVADGTFDIYVSAVDDAGNESDYTVATGVPVDFLAPTPPTGIVFA